MKLVTVPPKSLAKALAHLRAGGELYVPTHTHCYKLTKKALEGFEAAGMWLLKEEGEGYRMKVGRSGKSVYVLPGQLKAGE